MSTAKVKKIKLREITLEHFKNQIAATKAIKAERERLAASMTGVCTYPGDFSRCKWITDCKKCRFVWAAQRVAKAAKKKRAPATKGKKAKS